MASLADSSQVFPPEYLSAERATVSTSGPRQKAADTTASLDEPKPYVVAALTDPSQVFPPEGVTATRT